MDAITTKHQSWAGAAVGVLGLWFIMLVVFCVIWAGNEFYERAGWMQALVATALIVFAPAYGWSVSRRARQQGQPRRARGAKVAAVVALVFNFAFLGLMLLFVDAVKHIR